MAGASEDLILSVDVALLHQLVPPLLRDEDTRIQAATCLARRVGCSRATIPTPPKQGSSEA